MKGELILQLLKRVTGSKTNPVDATQALNQLYMNYGDIVYDACVMIGRKYNIVRQDERIGDLTQDVWERIATKAHTFDPIKSKAKSEEKAFFNWVAGIATRILWQNFRKTNLVKGVEAEFGCAEQEQENDQNTQQQARIDTVREYLNTLQKHEADIILTTMLYRPFNVPKAEIARLMTTFKLTAANIRQIRKRILLKIAQLVLDNEAR